MNSHDARQAEVVPDEVPGADVSAVPQADASAVPQADASAVPQGDASAVPQGDVSAVRGAPEWRQLSFRASGLTIELEITGSGDHRRLMGQLIPRQPAVVDIRHADGVITVEADELGRFSADDVPLGQISLRCRLGNDQSPVVTGWITL